MLAKFKKTGQIVNVPDEFYKSNPDLYEAPSTSSINTQQTINPNKGGDVLTQGKDLVMSLLSPFLETGKRIGGAVYEGSRALDVNRFSNYSGNVFDELNKTNQELRNEKDPQKKQSLLEQSRKLSDILYGYNKEALPSVTSKNPLLSNQEMQDIVNNPRKELIKQAGRGAQMVSWGLPGGGFLNSAKIGALQSVGRQLEENQNIDPTQTAISAGVGGVTGKLLDKILGTGKTATEVGQGLRKSVIKPKVEVGPGMFNQEQDVVKIAEELGLKGTPDQMKEQIAQRYGDLIKQHSDIIQNSTGKISINTMKKMVKDQLTQSGFTGDAYDKIVESQVQRLSKGNASFVSGLKTTIGKELGTKFNNPTTPRQEVLRTLWDVLDGVITKIEPQAKNTTLEMSKLYKVIPGIAEQAKAGVSIPVPLAGGSIRTSAAPITAAKDVIGRGLISGGGALDKILGKLGGKIGPVDTRTAAVEGVTALLGGGTKPQQTTQQEQIINPIIPQSQQQETTDKRKEIAKKGLQLAMIQDLAKGGKHIAQISAIAKAVGLDSASGLSATEKQAVEQAKVGLNLVDTLEGEYNKVQGEGLTAQSSGLGLLGGIKGSLAAASQTSPSAAAYDQTKQAFLSKLSRASGEKGVLTDQDIKRIEKAIPSFYDTPEVASEKLALIRQIIGGAIESKTASGQDNNLDISSLLPSK